MIGDGVSCYRWNSAVAMTEIAIFVVLHPKNKWKAGSLKKKKALKRSKGSGVTQEAAYSEEQSAWR